MSYEITTIEQHQKSLDGISARHSESISNQVDAGDNFLSSWASGIMSRFHHHAIGLLENGLKAVGKEVPYAEFNTLFDENDNVVSKNLQVSQFGGKLSYYWVLKPEYAQKFGRRNIPSSKNSRIQKQFGLKELKINEQASQYMGSSSMGSGVSFKAQRLKEV